METITKYPQSNRVVTTGWTDPTFAYADDTSYAICTPSKNTSVITEFYNFDFGIPTGATINSITIYGAYFVSTQASQAIYWMQVYKGASAQGTQYEDLTEPLSLTEQSHTDNGTWSAEELSDNTTSGFLVRVTGRRIVSNTVVTLSLDYIKVTIDYTALPTYKPLTAGATLTNTTFTRYSSRLLTEIVDSTGTARRLITRNFIKAIKVVRVVLLEYDGYILQRKDGAGSYLDIARLTKGLGEYTDCQGLIGDETYCYRIKRIRFGLESAWSNEECILFSASTQHQKGLAAGITITLDFDKRTNKTTAAGVRITRTAIRQVRTTKTTVAMVSASIRRHMSKITKIVSRLAANIRKPASKTLTEIIRATATSRRFTTRTLIEIAKATGTVVKRTARTFLKINRASGIAVRRTMKSLNKTIKAMATAFRLSSLSKILTAAASAFANTRRHTIRTLIEIVRTSGSVVKRVVRTFIQHARAGGSVIKRSARTLTETVTASGLFYRIKVYLKTLSVAAKGTSALSRAAVKKLNIGIKLSVQTLKHSARTLLETISIGASITKQTFKRLSDQIATAAIILRTKIAFKLLSVVIQSATSTRRAVTKSIISGSDLVTEARRRTTKTFARTITAMRSISKRTVKSFMKMINVSGLILQVKAAFKNIIAAVSTFETVLKRSTKYLPDVINLSAQVVRANALYKLIIATASAAGSATKGTFKAIVSGIKTVGFWIRVNQYYLILTAATKTAGYFNRVQTLMKHLSTSAQALGIVNKTREHLRVNTRDLTLETLQRELILEIEGEDIMAYIGDTIRLVGRFHDFSGALSDVDEELVTIYDGKKNVLLIAVPDRQDTGIYTYDFTIPDCVSDPVIYEFSGVLEGSVILARSTIKRRWV